MMSLFRTAEPCFCGSGLFPDEIFDARGIYLCRACDQCAPEKLAGFRPEVLGDPNYECDEDVEPDNGYDFDDFD